MLLPALSGLARIPIGTDASIASPRAGASPLSGAQGCEEQAARKPMTRDSDITALGPRVWLIWRRPQRA